MDLIDVKLAFMTMPYKVSTVCFHGWPIIVLEDFLSEGSTIDMTVTFTGMGAFNNLVGFLFIETPEINPAKGPSMQDTSYDLETF